MSRLFALLVVISVLMIGCAAPKDPLPSPFSYYKVVDRFSLPNIANAIDRENYARLAGIYMFDKPDSLVDDIQYFDPRDFSWGKDYSLGKYAKYIDYGENGWSAYGNGLSEPFKITASTANTVTIDFGEHYDPRTADLTFKDNELVGLDSVTLYKISGPDRPMEVIRKILQKKQQDQARYQNKVLSPSEAKLRIGQVYAEVFRQLQQADYDKLRAEISERKGIRFGLNSDPIFLSAAGGSESDFQKNVNGESQTIDGRNSSILTEGTLYFNEFRYLNLGKIASLFPGSITVEMYKNYTSFYGLIFVNEGSSWKIACVLDGFDQE